MTAEIAAAPPPTVREPKQGRSRASFEKAIAAARTILARADYDNFTLADVVKSSGVSIGSIYGRVSSKDDLLRVVQERVLEEMAREEDDLFAPERWEGVPLAYMVPALLEGLAELLRRHASTLRAFMLRAATDDVILNTGRTSALKAAKKFESLVLLHRAEIRHPDPERAVHACFTTAYACYSRYLGLGTAQEAAGEGDWLTLKSDVVLMCVCFLQFADQVHIKPGRPRIRRPAGNTKLT